MAILFAALVIAAFSDCSQTISGQSKQPQTASAAIESSKPAAAQTSGLSPEIQKSAPERADDVKTDSGRYTGQADSNFIEIKISGVPDEKAAKVFMLSENLKKSFSDLGLETGDAVRFDYYVNEHQQNVLVKIEKI